MKKLIVILIIVVTLGFAGALFGKKILSDEGKVVKAPLANRYPPAMPEVILDPMVGFPLY